MPSITRVTLAARAPISFFALSAIAWNTGCASDGDAAMTFRISAVAICASRASASSRSRSASAASSASGVFGFAAARRGFGGEDGDDAAAPLALVPRLRDRPRSPAPTDIHPLPWRAASRSAALAIARCFPGFHRVRAGALSG